MSEQSSIIPLELAENSQREKGIKNWVNSRVLASVPSERVIDFGGQFKDLPVAERANRLYERLMVFSVDQRLRNADSGEAHADQIDPDVVDVVSEIASLWQDGAVQQAFVSKFANARVDAKFQRASQDVSDFRQIIDRIEETRTAFTAESRRLFLQEAKTDLQVSASSGRVERYAQELVQLEKNKQNIFTLDGKDAVPENTDVSANIMYETLRAYGDQAKEGFVWVPSRVEIGQKIKTVLDSGKYPLLIGPPGTGKTTQIRAVSKELTDTDPVQVDASSSSGVHDMMATTEMGKDESFRRYVGIGRGFTGFTDSQAVVPECPHGRVVEFNEISQLNLDRGLALIKGVAAKRTGSILHEEVGRPILPGSTIIATSNEPISDERLDREFGRIPINYFEMTQANPELYEFMLSMLMTDHGNLPASREELAPYFQKIKAETGKDLGKLKSGDAIVGREELVEDQTDTRHGTLYRLSFAIRALQDAYIHGSQYNEKHMARTALYYDYEDIPVDPTNPNSPKKKSLVIKNYVPDLSKPGADQGVSGEMLTLHAGSSTLTVETITNWVKGFRTRMESDIPEYHTKNMSDWIKVKLEEHIAQAPADEADKIRTIFNHFHLFDKAPELANSMPLTPKEIGYLSPRVKRPVTGEKIKSDSGHIPPNARDSELYEDLEVMLEDHTMILATPKPLEFAKHGNTVRLTNGKSFTIGQEKFRYVGVTPDEQNIVIEFVDEKAGMHRILTKQELMGGEFDNLVDEAEAKDIFGEDFFGVEAVKKAFGLELRDDQIPELIFTREELEKAKGLDQRLVLRVDRDPNGQTLTMKKIRDLAEAQFKLDPSTEASKGKALFDTSWYKDEDFFTTQAPRAKWALVGKEVLPSSTNIDYLKQTALLATYLESTVFEGGQIPQEYQEALDEFNNQVTAIAGLMTGATWKEAADKLSALKLNQLTRQTPAEVLYDMMMVLQNTEGRFLPDKYTWTNAQSRGGSLVRVGGSDADGAFVDHWYPNHTYGSLGVVFSR